MGKCTRKGKVRGDVSMMELPLSSSSSSSSSYGVRTRARTLALQPHSDLSCLQLRTRRLHKPPPPPNKQLPTNKHQRSVSTPPVGPTTTSSGGSRNGNHLGVEPSCGDNRFEFDSVPRSTRESTPCSLIRGTETIATPGSTTRSTCSGSAIRRACNALRTFPTTPEMDEFFAGVELHQQQQFIDKYNYDIMNDLPLPGRYEWVRVDY